ncbi:hypothetical protein AB0A76_17105 [Streptomyces exfoliatus]|uniref:Uncharacterized protein n=1 Tax=Streptomyces exfoliatus TaxID=1905 RepID=A0ABV3CXH6_STREX
MTPREPIRGSRRVESSPSLTGSGRTCAPTSERRSAEEQKPAGTPGPDPEAARILRRPAAVDAPGFRAPGPLAPEAFAVFRAALRT